jgi:hypothetical protein
MSYNETVKDTLNSVLELVLEKLEGIEEDDSERIDIHDLVHEEVDNAIASNSRKENEEIIDDTGNEEYVDKGLIDNSSLDRMIETTAYGCLEQELWNNDVMQKIQRSLSNNDMIDYEDAQELIEDIKAELE